MKVSFILASRNDGFSGPHHLKRLELTLASIQRLPCDKEIVLVECCPNGSPLPDYPNVRKITVPDMAHEIITKGVKGLKFYEYLCKEIGARVATGDAFIFTNPDCIFPLRGFKEHVLDPLSHGAVVRANREDVVGHDHLEIEDLIQRAENFTLPIADGHATAAGDFTGIPRIGYRMLGGYRMVHGAWDLDNDLVRKAEERRYVIHWGYRHFHLAHTSQVTGQQLLDAHLHPEISKEALRRVFRIMGVDGALAREKYDIELAAPSDIHEHLPALLELTQSCRHVTEFGVRWAASTSAWLHGGVEHLRCHDINVPRDIEWLKAIAEDKGVDFQFTQGDTSKVDIEPTDLLFLDTLHTHEHLIQEIAKNHEKVSQFMVFHDTESNGWQGENGGGGLKKTLIEFMLANPGKWFVAAHFTNNHGLTILRRL